MFLHIDAVYSLSVNPVNDNVFASSSDDGRVLIWDTRGPPNAGEGRVSRRLFIAIFAVFICSSLFVFLISSCHL